MSTFCEYILFILACTCAVREVFFAPLMRPRWQVELLHLLRSHLAWIDFLRKARGKGLLGGLRVEEREGTLCVVGLGYCRPVQSLQEGVMLINRMKGDISGLFA